MLLASRDDRNSAYVTGCLCVALLSACGEPPQTNVPVETPVTTVTEPQQESAIDRSEVTVPEQVAPTPVKPRTLESLDLKLNDRPATVQTPSTFGAAPDSGWLDQGDDELDIEKKGLLPDLFEPQIKEKSVEVKTRVLIDDSGRDTSAPLDGAELSIEIKTD